MAIKAGQIVHVGNGVAVIDRIQTGGPGQLNIPTEKINELGNYKSVATIRDTPDLTFTAESFDVSTEFEQLVCGATTIDPVAGLDLAKCLPVDIASQFKAGLNAADPTLVTTSVALPYLYLEQMSYRFGLRDNATVSATLRGDSIFYNPGPTVVQTVPGSGVVGQTVATSQAAYEVAGADGRRVLSVTVGTKRLTLGADYTETYGTVTAGAATTTVTLVAAVPVTDDIRLMYSSPAPTQYPQSVHPDPTVKPAAVRGRDIEVYVGDYDPDDIPGSATNKLVSVQSIQADWRVTVEKDEEFGNYYAVNTDFSDVPQVNGSVDIKPRDDVDFHNLLRKVTGVTDPLQVIGPDVAVPLPLHVVIKHPDTHDPIKRLYVPDARFTVPGYQGRVQQKLTVTLQWESDEGTLLLFDE
jgi:hypothetical protein